VPSAVVAVAGHFHLDAVMASMREIEWEPCLLEQRRDDALDRRARATLGRGAGPLTYFAALPWLANVAVDFQACLLTVVHIEHDLADLVSLAVSQDNSCRYCFAVTRTFLILLGYPPRRIAHLEQQLLTSEFSDKERAAIDFARRLSRSNPLLEPAARDALGRAGFTEPAIRELTGLVGVNVFYNRLSTLPALPPETMEALPDRWRTRLLRPVLGRVVRRYRFRGAPVALTDAQRQGPFADVVAGFDGLQIGGVLHGALAAAWASPVLPVRTKALMFAVVARALGCTHTEHEARRLARAAGVADADAEQALAHLDSPALDDIERMLLPFARETVWYQPAAIQRRARELRESIGSERFLEVVAVAALANAVCRLGFVAALR
jgi:alkylhydroperoxidase family enzyme